MTDVYEAEERYFLPLTDDERRREEHLDSCWQGCDDLHPDEQEDPWGDEDYDRDAPW
ncbi:hypothetical protein Ade02nite_19140 [Paractinoplanes deccanensis]|uniref:Uncharacterized protein n=1 Tax=Paractinoplanes deccanensis TaxID=113561 RepID=A0ABQ3XZV1_9ACTN|nr:hypothetical protein [Actinoplanes deccanensis]GID73273.1 hypothetical protein Ade02nite_19140 [Actinoplanes deccanensis]